MARTKRKTNPVIPAAEAPAQAQKQYRAAAYARLSVEDSGKPGADTIEGQKNLLLRFIEMTRRSLCMGCFAITGRPARTSNGLSLKSSWKRSGAER